MQVPGISGRAASLFEAVEGLKLTRIACQFDSKLNYNLSFSAAYHPLGERLIQSKCQKPDPLPEMLNELKVLANKKDVPYQSLIKIYLAEKIIEERKSTRR